MGALYRISKEHWNQTIVALVYNVLKTFMEMNSRLFDDLTASYKADRQKEKKRERERDDLWRKMQDLSLKNAAKEGISLILMMGPCEVILVWVISPLFSR